MQTIINKIGNTTLNIISSTVVVLPFIFFLKQSETHQLMAVLPFVIFYTFRMTGIFFIRAIKSTLNSYTLLKLSIYCGIIASFIGFLGIFLQPLELISGLLLGLSAAWLPTANTTIKYYRKENKVPTPKSIGLSLLVLLLMGGILYLPNTIGFATFFVIYGLMYIIALPTLTSVSDYEVTVHDLEEYSPRYMILFIIFFILIFILRSSRLLSNIVQFDYFIIGSIFIILCLIIAELFAAKYLNRRLSNKLSYLTAINGAVGNYLFLFSSLYAAGYYGHNHLFLYFYLPYILGIVLAPKVSKMVNKKEKQSGLIGIFLGLLLVMLTPFFALGVLMLSTFKGVLNNWLTDDYMRQDKIPSDKRVWIKYSIQSIGSVTHQFILMLIGSLLVFENQASIKQFFVITTQKIPTLTSQELMQKWNIIASGILLIGIIVYSGVFGLNSIKKK